MHKMQTMKKLEHILNNAKKKNMKNAKEKRTQKNK